MSDELVPSKEEIAAELEAAKAAAEFDPVGTLTSAESTPEEEAADQMEVPDPSFWDSEDIDPTQSTGIEVTADEPHTIQSDVSDGETKEDYMSTSDEGSTITYKANGKEVSVSLDEAKKKLALADGARKAFSDKARLNKELKAIRKEREEFAKYKENWDKLESLKDNPAQLYEAITGQKYDDFVKEQVEQRRIYQEATPQERELLDREAELRNIKNEFERERRQRQLDLERQEEMAYKTEKEQLQSKLEREYFKYKFDGDPKEVNVLKKSLWRNAIADIKEYTNRGYEVSDKMIAKVFRDNSLPLQQYLKKAVEEGVSKKTEKKKAAAKEKAQLASTRNYSGGIDPEFTKMDPMSLFRAFQKRR